MKKKWLNVQINFSNRVLYSLIALVMIAIFGVGVYAFGTSTPSSFGHSAGELDLSGGVNGNTVFNGDVSITGTDKILNVYRKINAGGYLELYGQGYGMRIFNRGGSTGISAVGGSNNFISTSNVLPYQDGTNPTGLTLGSLSGRWGGVYTNTLDVLGQVKIAGGSPGSGKVLISDADGLASWVTPSSSQWVTSGSNIYYNTGNVGIGTTNINRKLDVVGQILAKTNDALDNWIEFWPDDSAIIAKSINPIRIGHATTPDATGWAERMRIDTSGNVGIGTTSPGAKLDVNGNIQLSSGGLINSKVNGYIEVASTYSNNNVRYGIQVGNCGDQPCITPKRDGVASTLRMGGSIYPSASNTYQLGHANNLWSAVYANAYYYGSDLALKKNIQPISNALGKVEQLQGVTFNWKENNQKGIGLIAQDVEKILPELVSGEDGSKSIAYGNLVAVLIEAVKEQQNEIEQLQKEVEELKNK